MCLRHTTTKHPLYIASPSQSMCSSNIKKYTTKYESRGVRNRQKKSYIVNKNINYKSGHVQDCIEFE